MRCYRSLPVWEEWIEIIPIRCSICWTIGSLPVWEEWIEMAVREADLRLSVSLPVWEEWIEIFWKGRAYHDGNVSSRMGRVD